MSQVFEINIVFANLLKGTDAKTEDFILNLSNWHVNRVYEIDIIFADLLKRTHERTIAAVVILFPIFKIGNVKDSIPIF